MARPGRVVSAGRHPARAQPPVEPQDRCDMPGPPGTSVAVTLLGGLSLSFAVAVGGLANGVIGLEP